MPITHLDHLVLTVRHIPTTVDFYTRALGMTAVPFGNNRLALHFGHQKINLHQAGAEIDPKAARPTPIPDPLHISLDSQTGIPIMLGIHSGEANVTARPSFQRFPFPLPLVCPPNPNHKIINGAQKSVAKRLISDEIVVTL